MELRSKSELIKQFIENNQFVGLTETQIEDSLQGLINQDKQKALTQISDQFDVNLEKLSAMVDEKITRKTSIKNTDFNEVHNGKVPLLKRNQINDKLVDAVQEFIANYY